MGACDAWHGWCRHDRLTLSTVITRPQSQIRWRQIVIRDRKTAGRFPLGLFLSDRRESFTLPTHGLRQCSVSDHPGIIRCHVLSRVVITVLAGWAQCTPTHCHKLGQFPVFSVTSECQPGICRKYLRNENTSQPLSLYDWPIKELGAAKRNHISDVIRISSELIRTWRQQLMQHPIMTRHPESDVNTRDYSPILTSPSYLITLERREVARQRPDSRRVTSLAWPRVWPPGPAPILWPRAAQPRESEMKIKINDGVCLFRTECEVKTAAGEK